MAQVRGLGALGIVAVALMGASMVVGCPADDSSTTFNNGNGGGGADTGQGGSGVVTLSGIVVTPMDSIVELDLGVPGSVEFQVTASYSDGTSEDVSSEVTWTVNNPEVGSISGNTLEIPAFDQTGATSSVIEAEFDGAIGLAQVTVVAYRQSGTQQDFFFVLPYEDVAGEQTKPLEFATEIPALDVFFMMDTTGSMSGEIANLQNALTTTIIPGISSLVPDTQFGAGTFEDFPVDPYGSLQASACGLTSLVKPDQPFTLLQEITNDANAITTAVGNFSDGSGNPVGCGADLPESMIEGLYQLATGEGLTGPGATSVAANTSGVGGVGFRTGPLPVAVVISDANSHLPGDAGTCNIINAEYTGAVAGVAHTRDQTKTALDDICGRVVGIASDAGLDDGCEALLDLEDFATSTGSRVPPEAWDDPTNGRPAGCSAGQCCTGLNGTGRAADGDGLCPVVYRADSNGSGLDASVVTGIQMLTRFATFDVTIQPLTGETESTTGLPLPDGTTTADFIQSMTPVGYVLPPAPPVIPAPTFDATGFQDVTPSTVVQFDVVAYNDFLEVTEPQIYRLEIQVLAGNCTPLDVREVLILVPPTSIVPQ